MKRCKHPHRRNCERACCSPNGPIALVFQWCDDCGNYASLGPSNDAGEAVETEMIAADYAAQWSEGNHVLGVDRFEWCPFNADGFCDVCQAFWLARAIFTHEES